MLVTVKDIRTGRERKMTPRFADIFEKLGNSKVVNKGGRPKVASAPKAAAPKKKPKSKKKTYKTKVIVAEGA